jgi:hypothetical protein
MKMNEIAFRRHLKRVLSYGVPKLMAEEIVSVALNTNKSGDPTRAINYAIDLVYGLGFTKKFAK